MARENKAWKSGRNRSQPENCSMRISWNLRYHSGNSSMPPSSDRPEQAPPKVGKTSTGKKAGRTGRACQTRKRVDPNRTVRKGRKPRSTLLRFLRQQARRLRPESTQVPSDQNPANKARNEEHRIHTLTCSCCGKATTAKLPVGVPSGRFGPNVMASADNRAQVSAGGLRRNRGGSPQIRYCQPR